ncbi:MAG: hypothetical protein V4723_13375 [Pseudomonadota bacterium]
MNNPTYDSFIATLEEMGRAIAKAARSGAAALATMSWPVIAIWAVLLSVALTIVPLALMLFIIFMAVKLVFGAIAERTKRGPATPYTPTDDKGE